MRKVRKMIAVIMIAAMGLTMAGCYGSFTLTKKVHKWNGTMGNKFVKELVFLGLVIIPVYEFSVFIDAFILNTIEFWTGSNPMAFKPGNNEININGQKLTVNVQNERILISDETGKLLNDLQFNGDDNSWYSVLDGKSRKLMTINEETVQLYTTSGNMIEVSKTEISSKSTWMLLNEFVAAK